MKEKEEKEKLSKESSEKVSIEVKDEVGTVTEEATDSSESIGKEVAEEVKDSKQENPITDSVKTDSKETKVEDSAKSEEPTDSSESKEKKVVEEVKESKQKKSTTNSVEMDSKEIKDEDSVVFEGAADKPVAVEDESIEEVKDNKEEDKIPVPESATFLIGRKIGMTRIFDNSGDNHPVTIINVNPNIVTQVKSNKTDGYSAIQMGMGIKKKMNNCNKAEKGKFDKLGLEYKNHLKEFRISNSEVDDFSVGLVLSVDVFKNGDNVNITGITRGKGFTGHMKRHGFHGGRRSHGKNSVMRKAGAIGASADPARVWPGKKMAGRSGGIDNTVLNLTIVRVDSENNNLYVKGAVSGAKNGIVYIEG